MRRLIVNVSFAVWLLVPSAAGGAESRVTRRAEPFIVHDARPRFARPSAFTPKDQSEYVKLNADVLAGSADRIREGVIRELGLPSNRGGKIHLFLKPAAEPIPQINVASAFYADGWQYHISVPDQVRRADLVRVLVQAVLLEFANRGTGPKSAEIPVWLSEGLTFHLFSAIGPDLILEASPISLMPEQVLQTPVGAVRIWIPSVEAQILRVRGLIGIDSLRETRQFLRQRQVLSFSELARPSASPLADEDIKLYQASAQLFFHELRRLPEGKRAMINLLRALPHYWNWELAFLDVYRPRFTRLLDVEKWWSVTATAITGRDPMQVWPAEVIFENLDEILRSVGQVQVVTNALPVKMEVTLQQVISDWELAVQRVTLERVIGNLTQLRFNSPKQIVPLIDTYRRCLRTYLQRRYEMAASRGGRMTVVPSHRLVVQQTIQELDGLFRQRETLKRELMPDAQAVAGTR